MSIPLNVLILEDREEDARLVLHELRQAGFEPQWRRVDTEADYLAALDPSLDVVLADFSLPGWSASAALAILQARGWDIPFIIVSGTIGEDSAVAAMRQGAADYLVKDRLTRLGEAVRHALESRRLREERRALEAAHSVERRQAEDTQHDLEGRYRAILDSALDAIVTMDAAGTVLEFNPSAQQIFGYSRDEAIGQPMADLIIPPALREHHRRGLARYLATGQSAIAGRRVEVTALRRDGTEFPVAVSVQRIGATEPPLFTAFIQDITERKRAEEALRQREQRLSSIYQTVSDSIFYVDVEGDGRYRFNSINQAFVSTTGLDYNQVVGKRVDEVIPEPSLALVLEKYGEAIRERKVVLWEETSEYPKGRLTGGVSIAPVFDDAGTCTHLVGAVHDLTERKRTEESLARLATAVEQAAEAVMLADANATILYVNPAFEKATGYTREEAIGRNPRFLKSDRQDAEFYRRMWAVLTAGQVWSGCWFNKRKDDTLYEQDSTISPIRDAAGRIVNYVAVSRDVTDQKQLEAQFRQAQKMESVGQLAGGIAHDFNNLLTVMNGTAELALASLRAGDPLRTDLEEICRAGERAAVLTRQLLAFSRKQMMQRQVLSLTTVVAGMEPMIRRLIGENIDLVIVPTQGLDSVKADTGQIEQVLANLVVNAQDAMPKGGRVTIEVRNVELDEWYARDHGHAVRPGPYVMLAVSDTGTGMDDVTLGKIFEPFFTTKEIGRGTGLGLSTVYGIVKQSDGLVEVYSEVGQGTTFKIYLPQAVEVAEKKSSRPTVASARGTGTILLVEDADGIRHLAKRVLESAGYTVLAAANGEEALLALKGHEAPVALIITDIVMPGMSGPVLAKECERARPGTRVLYTSGYTDDVVVRHGVLEEGMHFLQKPFTVAELTRKVREVLDSQG